MVRSVDNLIAYKLLKLRKNGTLGSLFINVKEIIPIGQWLRAKCYPTKGYAIRPGWHAIALPSAPHLKKDGRVWAKVELRGVKKLRRPESQGGIWYIAKQMKVIERL